MPTPPIRPFPELPDQVKPARPGELSSEMAAARRELANIGRAYLGVYRWMFSAAGWALGQAWAEIRQVGRLLRNPNTSRQTLTGLVRALVRANIMYGAALVVALPLRGITDGPWTFMLAVTVVSMAVEMAWAGQWLGGVLKTAKVDLVKKPTP